MMASNGGVLAAGAVALALIGGFCFAYWVCSMRQESRQRRRYLDQRMHDLNHAKENSPARLRGQGDWVEGLLRKKGIAAYLLRLHRRLNADSSGALLPRSLCARFASDEKTEQLILKSGLSSCLTARDCAEASLRLSFLFAAAGGVFGYVISLPMAFAGMVAGAGWGATAPKRALKRLRAERRRALERDLSEMLEVIALGLRGGLSFDRSIELYSGHFSTALAADCAAAQRAWSIGFVTREEALRNLARGYDSLLLARTTESMVRSLRFGTSLAEVLESAAVESRAQYRARVEERVAKAPVKMMVPTGTLILPAMLLLVLGPVLLELLKGI